MTRKQIDEIYDEEFLYMDGYDDCIIGVMDRFGMERVIAYDWDKVIAKMVADGMTYEEAIEYHDFNQAGAFMGEKTPGFVTLLPGTEPEPDHLDVLDRMNYYLKRWMYDLEEDYPDKIKDVEILVKRADKIEKDRRKLAAENKT